MKVMPEDKSILAPDDPGGLEFRGNAACGISGT